MSAIFKRELKAYFSSPLGYIFLAVIYALSGYYFFYILANQANYIQYVFSSMFTVVMMIIPLLTMRLMSEDKKLKTDQLLLTSPVNITGLLWASIWLHLSYISSAYPARFCSRLCLQPFRRRTGTFSSAIIWRLHWSALH